MRNLRSALVCALIVPVAAIAAGQPPLVNLVMSDAKVIAGAQVKQARSTPFGVYVLTHMQPDDQDFQNFITETGFDPRQDVDELLIASNGSHNDPAHWIVLGRGVFNAAKIAGAAEAHGGVVTPYRGINVITGKPGAANHAAHTAVAFLDPTTAVMGDVANVQAVIDRSLGGAAPLTSLADKIAKVKGANDFWFTTLVPLSEFAGAMPDPNLGNAMKGNLLTAIQQASGGVKFGSTVQIYAEAVTRSEKDASSLVDVVKFLAGLIQLNRENDTTAAQVATLLDTLQTTTNANVMTMSLAIPESALENLLDAARQQKHAPARRKAPAGN